MCRGCFAELMHASNLGMTLLHNHDDHSGFSGQFQPRCEAETMPTGGDSLVEDTLLPEDKSKGADNKKKGRTKRYDLAVNVNKSAEKFKQDMEGVRQSLNSVGPEKDKVLQLLDDSEKASFETFISTMGSRCALVGLVLGNDEEALSAKQQGQACMEEEGSLQCIGAAEKAMLDAISGCESEDDVKTVVAQAKDLVLKFEMRFAAANRAVQDVSKALECRKQKATAALERDRKVAEKRAKMQEKDLAKRMKLAQDTSDDLPCLFLPASAIGSVQKEFASFMGDLQSARKQGWRGEGGHFYIKSAAEIQSALAANNVQGFVQVFEAQFPTSKQAKQKSRAQAQWLVLVGSIFFGIGWPRPDFLSVCNYA